jgi:hypothetical protein
MAISSAPASICGSDREEENVFVVSCHRNLRNRQLTIQTTLNLLLQLLSVLLSSIQYLTDKIELYLRISETRGLKKQNTIIKV